MTLHEKLVEYFFPMSCKQRSKKSQLNENIIMKFKNKNTFFSRRKIISFLLGLISQHYLYYLFDFIDNKIINKKSVLVEIYEIEPIKLPFGFHKKHSVFFVTFRGIGIIYLIEFDSLKFTLKKISKELNLISSILAKIGQTEYMIILKNLGNTMIDNFNIEFHSYSKMKILEGNTTIKNVRYGETSSMHECNIETNNFKKNEEIKFGLLCQGRGIRSVDCNINGEHCKHTIIWNHIYQTFYQKEMMLGLNGINVKTFPRINNNINPELYIFNPSSNDWIISNE
jgi:hypothetical protein